MDNFSTHTHLISEKQDQSGRSMVEMLGVLAVIGVLSVAGIAGFSRAMDKNKANTIINEAQKRATLVVPQIQLMGNENPTITEFINNDLGYGEFDTKVYTNKADNLPAGQFGIKVSGVSKNICQNILNTIGDNTIIHRLSTTDAPKVALTECGDDNTFLMVYNNDMSANPIPTEFGYNDCPENFYKCSTTTSCVATENDCPNICALDEDLSSGCVCPTGRDQSDNKCGNCLPTETYTTWTQPVLSSNGTMGGSNAFACSASSARDVRQAWRVFDGSNNDEETDCWHNTDYDIPAWISWYTINPTQLQTIIIKNRNARPNDTAAVKDFQIEYSDDNDTWTSVFNGYNPVGVLSETSFTINATSAHRYWRI